MSDAIDILRRYDSCSVSNAIERFGLRLRNQGYTDSSIIHRTVACPPLVAYAVTARIRCSSPPPEGHAFIDRTEWWDQIAECPKPRVVVIEDVDQSAIGSGAFIGETHAHILRAIGCVGVITNGAVRDLDRVSAIGDGDDRFQVFSGSVCVSHAYSHLVSIGGEVTVGGLTVASGDLLHGDSHGVVNVPRAIVGFLPSAMESQRAGEQRIIAHCQSSDFTIDTLRTIIREVRDASRDHPGSTWA